MALRSLETRGDTESAASQLQSPPRRAVPSQGGANRLSQTCTPVDVNLLSVCRPQVHTSRKRAVCTFFAHVAHSRLRAPASTLRFPEPADADLPALRVRALIGRTRSTWHFGAHGHAVGARCARQPARHPTITAHEALAGLRLCTANTSIGAEHAFVATHGLAIATGQALPIRRRGGCHRCARGAAHRRARDRENAQENGVFHARNSLRSRADDEHKTPSRVINQRASRL